MIGESSAAPEHHINPDRYRIPALDGARGCAVLAVMASHFEYVLPNVGLLAPIKQLMMCGWVGVDIFFALSGFLITGILLTTKGAINYYSAFYARRVLRIFPIYYLTLGVMFSLATIIPGLAAVMPDPSQRPFYLVFLENWLVFPEQSWPPNALGHFWSLAIEEQYYLIWPTCVALLSMPTLRLLTVALALGTIPLRIYFYVHNQPAVAFEFSALSRFDGLLLGSFTAVIFATKENWKSLRLDLWALALLLALVVSTIFVPETTSPFFIAKFTLLAAFAGVLVLLLAETDGRKTLLQRILTYPGLRVVGRYSYGMYVYHVPLHLIAGLVFYRYISLSLRSSVPFAIVYFLVLAFATFFLAKLSYEYLERPILDLKRFFKPRLLVHAP